jgi:zinc protease
MRNAILAAAVFSSLLLSTLAPAQHAAPASAPASQPTTAELLRDKSQLPSSAQERYRLVNQNDEIVSVLFNGLTVITRRVPSPVLAVRGYVYTGGVYEGPWLGGGLSHLLEHLVAGGSSKRRTEAENRNLLQQIGNDSNAYTSEDHTAYFINTTPDHLNEATDLLTGWIFGALITPDEYRREYQVVQRELEKGKGEPDRQFWYMSQMNRYLVSPARVPVIGYQEVIQGLSRDDVYNYYKLTYQPNNTVFSVAGNLDPEVMLKAVQQYVGDAKIGRVFTREVPDEPPVSAPRTLVATFPKLGQARLGLAFPSVKLDAPDMYPLDLLATILGSGESSTLVEELRDKRQLVSDISAGDLTPSYVQGSFEITLQLDPAKIADATQAVVQIIEDVKKNGVTEQQLQRAKTQVAASRVKSQQTAEAVASSLATDYMTTGDPHFADRYVSRMAKVTSADIQRVAREYLVGNRLVTTALLPAEFVGSQGLPKAEDLLRPVLPTTQSVAEQKASDVRRVTLDNGTILLLKRLTTAPLVTIQAFSLGGLTAEDAKTNGLGNLTLELAMRGTKNRSAQQIASELDAMGADFETASRNNTWSWQASCLKADFPRTLDIVGDVFNNASFPESELPQMKQRILAAIESQDADWTAQAFRFFKQKFYGPTNSPYQFIPLGTAENVQSFTRQQVQDWYDHRAKTARRVVAVYGDIDLAEAEHLVRQQFDKAPKANTARPTTQAPPVDTPPAPQPSVAVQRVEVQKTQQPLAGVVIGYDAKPVVGDPVNFPLDVGDTMASGYTYPTGYLHEILRGRGLVYVVHAVNQPGADQKIPGTFLVYAGCDPKNVNEVVDTILENIARLQGSPQDVQPDWFERSKQLMITAQAMDNETPAAQGMTAAIDELYGLGYDYHDKFPTFVRAVTLDDVRKTAAERLHTCVVTISTPDPDAVQVKTGPRTYTSFPPVDLTPRGVQHDAGGGK